MLKLAGGGIPRPSRWLGATGGGKNHLAAQWLGNTIDLNAKGHRRGGGGCLAAVRGLVEIEYTIEDSSETGIAEHEERLKSKSVIRGSRAFLNWLCWRGKRPKILAFEPPFWPEQPVPAKVTG